MRKLDLALAAATCLALAACASPTPYRPADDTYGYTDQQIEPDRYSVSFFGNSRTSRDMVESFVLYRAAELTLKAGDDWFAVVDRDTERSVSYYTTVDPLWGGYNYWPYCRTCWWPHYGPAVARTRQYDRYAAYATIVTREGEKPPDMIDAYDARAVIEELGPLVEASMRR
jgi:hypothetical protein